MFENYLNQAIEYDATVSVEQNVKDLRSATGTYV